MTNDTIQRVEELSTLAEKLAVQCEIKMGNYEEAIEYYEDVMTILHRWKTVFLQL